MANTTALISTILTAKYKEAMAVLPDTPVAHPTDIISLEKYLKVEGNIAANYVDRYEPFEIRSANKVYSHILKGTVDTGSPLVLQFQTDVDINTSTMQMGSPSGKKQIYNGVQGYIRRKVIIDYQRIDAIEYIRVEPSV